MLAMTVFKSKKREWNKTPLKYRKLDLQSSFKKKRLPKIQSYVPEANQASVRTYNGFYTITKSMRAL